MSDAGKAQNENVPGSDSTNVQPNSSPLEHYENEFNPVANSTMTKEVSNEDSSPQSGIPVPTGETSGPEKDLETPPSSICFLDNEETTRPLQNYDKIVSDTQDVIKDLFQLMPKQRRFLLVCAYQISSLQAIIMEHYRPLLSMMEIFLTYSNGFQTEWFFQYYRLLPQYADYALVLRDSQDKVVVNEIPNPVTESTLKYLTDEVVNNMFAGGLQAKVQRSLNMDVSRRMDTRNEVFEIENLPMKLWMELFETQSENAKKVEEICFELLSSVDLLSVDTHLTPKAKSVRFDENLKEYD